MADIKQADATIIQYSEKKLTNLVNHESPLHTMVKSAAQKMTITSKGRENTSLVDVRVQPQGGDIDGVHPAGAEFDYLRFKMGASLLQVGYEIGHDKWLDYSKNDANVLQTMAGELDEVAKAWAKLREATVSGDGTGTLAWVDTQANGSTTTVFKFITQGDGTHAKTFGAHFIKKGVQYDLIDPASGTAPVLSKVTFSSVDKVNNTATVGSATVAITAGMLATALKLVAVDTYKNVPKGLRYLYETGKTGWWQNANVTGVENVTTPGVNAAGRRISNALLGLAIDRSNLRLAQNNKHKILLSNAQHTLFTDRAEGLFQYAAGTDTYDTSVENARYKGNTFEKVKYMDADIAIGVPLNEVLYLERMAPGPIKGPDGGIFHKLQDVTSGRMKGTYQMAYGSIEGLGTDHPENGLLIYGLSHAGAATLANMYDTGLAGI